MKWLIIIIAVLLVIGGLSVAFHLIAFSFSVLAWVFHHPFISLAFIGAGIGLTKLIAQK